MKTNLGKLATQSTPKASKFEDVEYEERDIVRNSDGTIDAFASRVNAACRLQRERFTHLM